MHGWVDLWLNLARPTRSFLLCVVKTLVECWATSPKKMDLVQVTIGSDPRPPGDWHSGYEEVSVVWGLGWIEVGVRLGLGLGLDWVELS